jgi:hypothetical protein
VGIQGKRLICHVRVASIPEVLSQVFFDARTGALIRTPRVLPTEELLALEAERDR